MSNHGAPKPPVPNWLRAWYAFLVFMAFLTALSLLLN